MEKTTPEQRAELDLSCWRVAFNGAEPIRSETLDRFADAFAPAGFRREMFLPCYGLAEATLLVAGGPRRRLPVALSIDAEALGRGKVVEAGPASPSKQLVSSGQVSAGHRVVVVDPATRVLCDEDRIGEIWVSGPSVALGYWGRSSETEELLRATLRDGAGPFLRTGDLGFLKNKELFVTGRLKDLIILRGRNIYPQDIEWTAEQCHPALCAGGTAAFAIEIDGEERLAVVQEIERNRSRGVDEEVITAIRRAVAEQHDIDVYAIRLIKMLSLPKTSSGKVQRHACREGFLAGSLDVVAEWTRHDVPTPSLTAASNGLIEPPQVKDVSGLPSRDAIAAWLAAKVAGPLGIRPDEVDTRRPLAGFGIGSLQAVRLAAELEEWLGRKLAQHSSMTIPPSTRWHDSSRARTCRAVSRMGRATGGAKVASRSRSSASAAGSRARRTPPRSGACCATASKGLARFRPRDGSPGIDSQAFPSAGVPASVSTNSTPTFSAFPPAEAIFVDPQHRLLLELAWEALRMAARHLSDWPVLPWGLHRDRHK